MLPVKQGKSELDWQVLHDLPWENASLLKWKRVISTLTYTYTCMYQKRHVHAHCET